MENYKVIFLDVDGTLIDHTLRVPPSAKEAIIQAKAKGHKLYINTGRSISQIYDEVWALGFDGFIGGNGIHIQEHGKVIFDHPIPPELMDKIFNYLTEHQIGFIEESSSSMYAHTSYLPAIAQLLGMTIDEAREATDHIFPSTHYNCTTWHRDVNKVSFVLNEGVDVEAVREYVKPELILGSWALFGTKREFADIYQANITKGSGVEFVMRHLGKPVADACAFGDADNDIAMIKTAGVGVAMGNAIPSVKAAADYVTDPVTEDGLWKAFKHLGLID